VNAEVVIVVGGLLVMALLGYVFRSRTLVRIGMSSFAASTIYMFMRLRGLEVDVTDIALIVAGASLFGTILSFLVPKSLEGRKMIGS
jgi:type II secretory pathway pseudopilin PulG